MIAEMQFEAMLMRDNPPVVSPSAQQNKVSKNIKYAQKYGGQDETDSDSSKETSLEASRQLDKSKEDFVTIQKVIAEIALAATPDYREASRAADAEPSKYQQSNED
jgi:hypothetical protein